MKKKVLITGGAGFIGSHVVEEFLNSGFVVRVVDDLRFGYKEFVDKRAILYRCCLSDTAQLNKAIKGVDLVIHLAASSIISESFKNPSVYFENNVMEGVYLLEAMRRNKVKKIIYSSTSSVYGYQKKIPIKEDVQLAPPHPYAASKLAFEQALISYYHAYAIESVILRYYNVYGPRDEQVPVTRAIPMWMKAAVSNKPIPWYWNGAQTRDYIFVKDVAYAHRAVMNLDGFHIFNIGSGKGIRMKDMLIALENVVGRSLKTKDLGKRPGDVFVSIADIGKIKKAVGWKPRVTLSDGLRVTYEYYKKTKQS